MSAPAAVWTALSLAAHPRHAAPIAATTATTCESLLSSLFGGDSVDAALVANACSDAVEWDDLAVSNPLMGRDAVRDHIASKFPRGSKLVIERLSDGVSSGGFTWHREDTRQPGAIGLRGTLFCELDDSGSIAYVREGCEPIIKPGEATEALLKAATANMEKPEKPPPTFTPADPTTASGVATYLWEEAYPNGADPSEAIRLFADNIRYEDFNYPEPFEGIPQVTAFVNAFDIPGIEFVPLRISDGDKRCAFTWKVMVNGNEGPQGISFYEVDDLGKVCFIRDIPAPSPRGFRPLGALAAAADPARQLLTADKLASLGLRLGSSGMGLLKPLFAKEAEWQADALGGDEATSVRAAAVAELDAEVASDAVVVYTYGLSPFSTQAVGACASELK